MDGNALLLSEETAQRLGWVGAGPFTFAGVFPGEYVVGRPLEIRFLGYETDEAVADAYEAAFVDIDDPELIPLEWVTVDAGEGLPLRENHALSEAEAREEQAEEVVDLAAGIRTHKQADEVALDLEITFPEGATVEEKRAAIREVRATTPGDPNEITPAIGAEGTTPLPDEDDVVEEEPAT